MTVDPTRKGRRVDPAAERRAALDQEFFNGTKWVTFEEATPEDHQARADYQASMSNSLDTELRQTELNDLQTKLGDLGLLIPTVSDERVLADLKDWHAELTRMVATKTRSLKRPPRKKAESKLERGLREARERVEARKAASS